MSLFNEDMKKSLFWLLDYHPELEQRPHELMKHCIVHTVLSETQGFDAVWCAEHHFQHLGHIPNPANLLAALSQVTQTIRLGSAVSVLPLRSPIQVAEDYAMVDILSNGRLNMGVGTGGQEMESNGMGCDFDNRNERFEEHFSEILMRWKQSINGVWGKDSLNISPIQKPLPPIYISSNNLERIYEIGKSGHNLVTIVAPSVENIDEVGRRVQQHQRGLLAGGFEANHAESVVTVFTHICETEEEAKHVVVPALGRIISYLSGSNIPDATDIYTKMRSKHTGLFGTRDEVKESIARYQEAGIKHLAFINRFGGMDWEKALNSLKQLH